ncbi:MAG: transcriptional repressor LexA [Treponema sp.]|nr:transcriptional repressor LexA [Treponema sp.]
MKDLTERQKKVLLFVKNYIEEHSYSPSIREIAQHFDITMKGAHDHVEALRRKGALLNGNLPRTLSVVDDDEAKDRGDEDSFIEIPIVGMVAAGLPILTEENTEGTLRLDRSMLKKNQIYFAVIVRGDSMIGAGIMDGDTAVIEKRSAVDNGEIAVAVIDDAVTLKRIYKENSRIRLRAENPAYKDRFYMDVRIVGRLATIIRNY